MSSNRTPLLSLFKPTFGLLLAAATLPCAAQLRLDVLPEAALTAPPARRFQCLCAVATCHDVADLFRFKFL